MINLESNSSTRSKSNRPSTSSARSALEFFFIFFIVCISWTGRQVSSNRLHVVVSLLFFFLRWSNVIPGLTTQVAVVFVDDFGLELFVELAIPHIITLVEVLLLDGRVVLCGLLSRLVLTLLLLLLDGSRHVLHGLLDRLVLTLLLDLRGRVGLLERLLDMMLLLLLLDLRGRVGLVDRRLILMTMLLLLLDLRGRVGLL